MKICFDSVRVETLILPTPINWNKWANLNPLGCHWMSQKRPHFLGCYHQRSPNTCYCRHQSPGLIIIKYRAKALASAQHCKCGFCQYNMTCAALQEGFNTLHKYISFFLIFYEHFCHELSSCTLSVVDFFLKTLRRLNRFFTCPNLLFTLLGLFGLSLFARSSLVADSFLVHHHWTSERSFSVGRFWVTGWIGRPLERAGETSDSRPSCGRSSSRMWTLLL